MQEINSKWKKYKRLHLATDDAKGWTAFKTFYTDKLLKAWDNYPQAQNQALATESRIGDLKHNFSILEGNQLKLEQGLSAAGSCAVPREINTSIVMTDPDASVAALRAEVNSLKTKLARRR